MKILIQNPVTKEYYEGFGKWTRERGEAMHFSTPTDAALECRRKGFEADIILRFKGSSRDITIPSFKRKLPEA